MRERNGRERIMMKSLSSLCLTQVTALLAGPPCGTAALSAYAPFSTDKSILQRRLLKSIPFVDRQTILDIFSAVLANQSLSQQTLRFAPQKQNETNKKKKNLPRACRCVTTCGPASGDNCVPWFRALDLGGKNHRLTNNALVMISGIFSFFKNCRKGEINSHYLFQKTTAIKVFELN